MSNKISFVADQDVVAAIKDLMASTRNFNRSAVINKLLRDALKQEGSTK